MNPKRPFYRKKKVQVLLGIIAILVIVRLILPFVVLKYANNTLAEMDGYYGHVEDIDLAIYRGAYKIKNIYLNKVDSNTQNQTPFFDAYLIDLSIDWPALFDGKITGELMFEHPTLIFTKDKSEIEEVQKDTNDFRMLLDRFMPLRVNRFAVDHGKVHYIDSTSKPAVNIKMDRMQILAKNLTNVKTSEKLPASIIADAHVYQGSLHIDMQLDPLAEQATFDMNAELNDTHLPEVNNFFQAYGKFDVNKGTFGLYTEIAASDGRFTGYVKPVIKDLKVLGHEDREDNLLRKLWEGVVGAAGMVFENPKEDQVATKIPLKGTFKNADADIAYALFDMLRNAFIQALQPSIDYEISIQSVYEEEQEKKGLLKRIFKKKDKDEKKGEEVADK